MLKKCWVIFLMFLNCKVWAVNTYDPATGLLKLDAVVVNDTQFNDVQVKLNAIDVLKIGSSQAYGEVTASCSDGNLSLEHFNAITQGMSLGQVKQIIGCTYTPSLTVADGNTSRYTWDGGLKYLVVIFDAAGNNVTKDSVFKIRAGF